MALLDVLGLDNAPQTPTMGIGQSPLNMLLEKTGAVPKEMTAFPNGLVGDMPKTPAMATPAITDLLGALGGKGLDILRPGLAAPLLGTEQTQQAGQGGALSQFLSEVPQPVPATQAPAPDQPATPQANPLAEAAKAEEQNDSMFAGIGDWLNDDANRRMLLGIGAALSQGRPLPEAIAAGVQLSDQFKSGKAASAAAGAKASSEAALRDAQAKKALAEATKIAKETGAKGEDLKGFRNSFKTIIGEAGGFGDPMAIATAQAQAAQQELSAKPDSEALKKLLDSSIESILMNIDSMDTEDAQEALTNAKNQFGADKVDAIARKIVGG